MQAINLAVMSQDLWLLIASRIVLFFFFKKKSFPAWPSLDTRNIIHGKIRIGSIIRAKLIKQFEYLCLHSVTGRGGDSPSLKVQSWLRMRLKDSSFNSAASSATLRSTYTIICFSWFTKMYFSGFRQIKQVSKTLFLKKIWFSACKPCS